MASVTSPTLGAINSTSNFFISSQTVMFYITAPDGSSVPVDKTELYPTIATSAESDHKENLEQEGPRIILADPLPRGKVITDLSKYARIDNRDIISTINFPFRFEGNDPEGSWRALPNIAYENYGFKQKLLPNNLHIWVDPIDFETVNFIDNLYKNAVDVRAIHDAHRASLANERAKREGLPSHEKSKVCIIL